MATFQYQAHREGQLPVDGRIEADDLDSALALLKKQGFVVESIRQLEVGQARAGAAPSTPSPARSAEAERLALRRQFDRVMKSGKSLAPVLFAYAEELPPASRRRVHRLANQLEHGQYPSQVGEAGQIDEQWIPLLSASASSRDPSQILSGIIDESQRARDLRGQFAKALAYPLLLLMVLLALMSLFAWWLIPGFHDIFVDFDAALPAPTQLVIGISELIRDSYGLVILIPVLLLVAMIAYVRIRPRSELRDWVIQRIPLVGSTVRLSDRARFTRCLADLMDAEVQIADALRISGRNTGETSLRREANRLATQMESGRTEPPVSASSRPVLPQTVTHVLRFNADPRAAAQILRELSWMYDQQTRNRLEWISSVSSPIFVIVLGIVVGFYVISLFLPLISLIGILT